MAILNIMPLMEIPESDVPVFMKRFEAFIKEKLRPSWIGVREYVFKTTFNKVKVGFGGKTVREVVMESNKAVDAVSAQTVRNLSYGFRAGWEAAKNSQA